MARRLYTSELLGERVVSKAAGTTLRAVPVRILALVLAPVWYLNSE